jgi:hypothetical protein
MRPESSLGSMPGSRPITPMSNSGADGQAQGTPPDLNKLNKKKSWLPSKPHNRAASETTTAHLAPTFAFVAGPAGKQSYDTSPLITEQKVGGRAVHYSFANCIGQVPEIWNDEGDLFIYLGDPTTTPNASFRLWSSAISNSKVLTGQSTGQSNNPTPVDTRQHLRQASLTAPPFTSGPGSQPMSRSSSGGSIGSDRGPLTTTLEERSDGFHLYLHLRVSKNATGNVSTDGLEKLIRIRNLFGFLVGQVLVGTPSQPNFFFIFNNIASLLSKYEFTNMDNTSPGEAASSSFLGYVEDLRLNDVRSSREKTLEALVLGEKMKCWPLYNEGYVHAVGKYSDLINLKTPVMSHLSDATKQRMEKSALALDLRLKTMRARLEHFEFPALFAGVLNSSSTKKVVDINAWKAGFVAMRKHTLNVYKARHGSWPPKARSKKNDFEGSGLNRIVTQEMYKDFSDLYDMLVDRTSLTTRSVDGHDVEETSENPVVGVLRKFMSEFDRSSPPVLPPIPYDIPLMPKLEDVRRDFADLNLRKQVKERSRKAKDDEVNMALMASYNRDAVKASSFLESFMAFERNNAHGKTFDEIIDARVGQWIFLYVIIQCLPLLAADAPDLRWTAGVEYFLCELPKGSPPWVKEELGQKKFYSVAGGAGVVSLPADVVDHGVEGTYFRSHCWQVASQWNANIGVTTHSSLQGPERGLTNYEPPFSPSDFAPPPVLGGSVSSRPGSRAGSRPGSAAGIRGSMALGLEALPAPPSMVDAATTRRLSMTPDPNRNFDSILASTAKGAQIRKKK